MSKDYIYDATVVSIYDGDSVRMNIDLGFNTWIMNEPIRFYGIDAPEIRGDERPEGLITKEWLVEKLPIGSEVILHSHKDKAGKYGRYLGTIYLDGVPINIEIGGVSLNQAMVDEGLAKPYFP